MERKFDISKITEYLYISEFPQREDVQILSDLGINLVISMTWRKTPKALESLPSTHITITAVDSPIIPIAMKGLFRGVETALPIISSGGKVLVHCKHGVHRSVAMCACILIAKGYTSGDAIKLIKEKRPVAGPETTHIKNRIIKFEKEWKKYEK